MSSFVRFVFVILIVGMVVNLAIVLAANVQSQRHQTRQYQREIAEFKTHLTGIAGHVRRADIVVESQRIDAYGNTLESTLLVRQYASTGTSQENPLPVVRIVIPGDQLQAGGVVLEFDHLFAPESDEFAMLRNTQLPLFSRFCGATETPAADQPDERFTFFQRDQVPELVRLQPRIIQAGLFESRLWQYLWTLLPDPPRDAKYPWVSARPGSGLRATWLKPATITVTIRDRHTYTAYISADGAVTLDADQPGMTGLLKMMMDEGQMLRMPPPE
jgi:hypothetical protein